MSHHRALVALYQAQSDSIVNITSYHVRSPAYLRRQSAGIELKGCRIVVAFWSSSSLIVFGEFWSSSSLIMSGEFQGRIVSVHASRFGVSQFGAKENFEVTFEESHGRSTF